jgi:predicted anti-sigma-YlaC factor YlaD
MRCKAAREAIFQDGLGLLDGELRDRLGRHCADCPSCRTTWRQSAVLDRQFEALRRRPVPAVDVHQVVLQRIRATETATSRGFAWALAAATAASAAFIALTLVLMPHALPLLRAAGNGALALVRSASPLLTLGSALVQAGGVFVRPLLSLGAAFGALEPMAWPILIAGACSAVAASFVIVSRGFLKGEPAVVPKES